VRKRKLNWAIPYQASSKGGKPAPPNQKCWAGKGGKFDQAAFIAQLLKSFDSQR